jgi:hypothetical protein
MCLQIVVFFRCYVNIDSVLIESCKLMRETIYAEVLLAGLSSSYFMDGRCISAETGIAY